MYTKILVALENSWADDCIVNHASALARQVGAELLLLHVADGFAARNFEQLRLAESEEMKADRAYLEATAGRLRGTGLRVGTMLSLGNPPCEILKAATASGCDLIAMASHGHKLIGDIIHGSTIGRVRHNTTVPMLIVRATK